MICFSFETSVPEDRYRLNTNDGNMKKFGELTDISGKSILDQYSSKPIWSVLDIEGIIEQINANIHSALKDTCSMEKVEVPKLPTPWRTDEVVRLQKAARRTHHIWQNCRSERNYIAMKRDEKAYKLLRRKERKRNRHVRALSLIHI